MGYILISIYTLLLMFCANKVAQSLLVNQAKVLRRACSLSTTTTSTPHFEGYSQPETKRGAYEAAVASPLLMPVIILVNPFLDQNVGSVARAMLNFGFHELRIVNPRCDILSEGALALAAGAVDVLHNAKVYQSLEDCSSDLQRIMATTVRPRHMTQMVLTPSAAAQESLKLDNSVKCGIMFGRERSGLTNEEVALADTIISIPSFKHFSSLNLAQAVNIVCSETWKQSLQLRESAPPGTWLQPRDGQRLARRDEIENFFQRLEVQMTERNFQNDENRRDLCFRNIRNIFLRTQVTKQEVDLLHGMLSCLVKPVEKDQ